MRARPDVALQDSEFLVREVLFTETIGDGFTVLRRLTLAGG
nr:hypothetical protein GCM10010200_010180 [Actinomadura rugatobispora]